MSNSIHKLKILFRVDSSSLIGNGHLMRCIALADALRERHCECFFLTRDLVGSDYQRITDCGFNFKFLPRPIKNQELIFDKNDYTTWAQSSAKWDSQNSASILFESNVFYDWIVIDNYTWCKNEHKNLASFCKKIMVIDDLENRPYHAHLLLDSGAYNVNKYESLCADEPFYINGKQEASNAQARTKFLIGPDYLLLNKSYLKLNDNKNFNFLNSDNTIKKICIISGATDPNNINSKVFDALVSNVNFKRYKFTFILSGNAPHIESLKKAIKPYNNCTVLVGSESLVSTFLSNDLLITACGGTLWEGAVLSCPMAIFKSGPDQSKNFHRFITNNAAYDLSADDDCIGISKSKVKKLLELCYEKPKIIKDLRKVASELCDGQGSKRVASAMLDDDFK